MILLQVSVESFVLFALEFRMSRHFAHFVLLLSFALLVSACGESPSPIAPAPAGQGQENPEGNFSKTRLDTFVLRAYDLDSVHLAGSANG